VYIKTTKRLCPASSMLSCKHCCSNDCCPASKCPRRTVAATAATHMSIALVPCAMVNYGMARCTVSDINQQNSPTVGESCHGIWPGTIPLRDVVVELAGTPAGHSQGKRRGDIQIATMYVCTLCPTVLSGRQQAAEKQRYSDIRLFTVFHIT
jgi:hypothetical protein